MKTQVASLFLLFLALAMTGCQSPHTPRPCCAPKPAAALPATNAAPVSAPSPQVFQVRGVVKEIRPDAQSALIRHEEIPGYMAAMTMPFDVKSPAELAGVGPGDTVSFRLTVTETDGWIDQVRVLEKGAAEVTPAVPSLRITREVEELEVGDTLPDYLLVSEAGRPVRLSDFKGRVLGFTFIYTRCPYPTFCPRQSRQFAEAASRLAEQLPGPDKRWHLLSISFDPGHDTPAVLRRYARQYDFDPAWWNFCTGAMIEIDALTEQFGMFFARDGEGFSHNVRTVVVDAAGRIRRIFVGNEWTTDEFVAAMLQAAGVK